MEYYGMRRKRNIDLSAHLSPSVWKEEVELEEGYEYEEIEDELEEDGQEAAREETYEFTTRSEADHPLYLDGKPFVPKQLPKKQSFADNHVRITTYLDKNVHQIIRMLQKQGQIDSITKFVNASIKHYLLTEYKE